MKWPLAGVLLALAVVAPQAMACSCVSLKGTQAEQVERSLADARAVFVARLTRSSVGPDREHRKVVVESAQFEVLEVFKGPVAVGQTIYVNQVVSAGSCGQSSANDPPWIFAQKKADNVPEPVKISKKWLIYAYGDEPFELSRCTRSAPLNVGGDQDVKLLRAIAKRKH
jgi:hypothetical protein